MTKYKNQLLYSSGKWSKQVDFGKELKNGKSEKHIVSHLFLWPFSDISCNCGDGTRKTKLQNKAQQILSGRHRGKLPDSRGTLERRKPNKGIPNSMYKQCSHLSLTSGPCTCDRLKHS